MFRSLEELAVEITIDKNKLDDELIKQPQLYWEVSEGYADAISKRDQSKQVLEQVEATTGSAYRLSDYSGKVTEAKVNEHVKADSSYVQQYQLHIAYKAKAEAWSGLKESFSQRCSMLRELVTLHTTGYWGSGVDSKSIEVYKKAYRDRNEE